MEILNRTPKGDKSGKAQAFCDHWKDTKSTKDITCFSKRDLNGLKNIGVFSWSPQSETQNPKFTPL